MGQADKAYLEFLRSLRKSSNISSHSACGSCDIKMQIAVFERTSVVSTIAQLQHG